MRRFLSAAAAVAVVGLFGALAVGIAGLSEDPFPHEEHAGLFPVCTGCHEGAATGDASAMYPSTESCVNCHDGVEEDRVEWFGPSTHPSNLRFDHVVHTDAVAAESEDPLPCTDCHTEEGVAPASMAVRSAQATGCLNCHTHESPDHFVQGDCVNCHTTLVEAALPYEVMEAFERPSDHEAEDFLSAAHGASAGTEVARCATCHVQNQCVECHVDGAARSAVAELPVAPSSLRHVSIQPRYPTPLSHEAKEFVYDHATTDAADCATCHTRQDCAACHIQPGPPVVSRLAEASTVPAPGVGLVTELPGSHQTAFWGRTHGFAAASDNATCTTCHDEQAECASCHDGPTESGFHPARFMVAHAAEAAIADAECATCHSVEQFCRACHVESGLGSQGRLQRGYHDAEPVWLLRHGQAARQQLETCASCHTQNDCTQCHSTFGAFQVNPHGPDFDPGRARGRAARACALCHISDPGGGVR